MIDHHQSRPGDHSHITRRLAKTIIVNLALWDILPASWACKLLEDFRHD